MKSRLVLLALLGLSFIALPVPLAAIEKDGLLVNVQQTALERNDGQGGDYREINRTMALKLQVKNASFKDLPAGTVKYTVLIRRWLSETGTYVRYTGKTDIAPLLRSKNVDLVLGEYPIGGHLHGTSRMHVDEVAGWKLEFLFGEKATEMTSKSNFAQMDKGAVASTP